MRPGRPRAHVRKEGKLACKEGKLACVCTWSRILSAASTHGDCAPGQRVFLDATLAILAAAVRLCYCAGGSTRFDVLGLDVQPKQGKALLFFPSFSNGVPDKRTLHTATDAVSEKWVVQLWTASGLAKPKAQGELPAWVRGGKGSRGASSKGKKVLPQRMNTKV
jgi:hypothetical protein